jgi:hypothetical protein
MNDVKCPYCGEEQEIIHDDGEGYEEDRLHEQECRDCEKSFTFYTNISFDYIAFKADCLNGADHRLRYATTNPTRATRMECKHCEYSRPITEKEIKKLEDIWGNT